MSKTEKSSWVRDRGAFQAIEWVQFPSCLNGVAPQLLLLEGPRAVWTLKCVTPSPSKQTQEAKNAQSLRETGQDVLPRSHSGE